MGAFAERVEKALNASANELLAADLVVRSRFIPARDWTEEASRRGLRSALYWLLSLQGLRHAHPLMFIPWIALGGYLAVYHVFFVAVTRQLVQRQIPLFLAVPVVWVGQEWIRNYLLTEPADLCCSAEEMLVLGNASCRSFGSCFPWFQQSIFE